MADNNLVVLTFDGADAAAGVYEHLEDMEKEKLVKIADAIIIERTDLEASGDAAPVEGIAPTESPLEDHVRVVQTHGKKGKYATGGAGIGFLAGFLLGGPIGGMVVGAGLGAVTGALKDFGIDDKSIEAIKTRLQPSSSALLVLGQVMDRDAFIARLRTFDPNVLSTSLPSEVEQELRSRLGA